VGKKTKKEIEELELGLEAQMNLAQDLAYRNPRLKPLMDLCPNFFINKSLCNPPCEDPTVAQEIEQLFSEIYGDIFPTFPWPVIEMPDLSNDTSEAVFKIDLNYTKDEIMAMLEKFVSAHLRIYKENHRQLFLRKIPIKWLDYLELWDLRGPDVLETAINRVKKQYRSAYRLITGETYNPKLIQERLDKVSSSDVGQKRQCDTCPDKPFCEELCPDMLESLALVEGKQQEFIVPNLAKTDLDQYVKTTKKPTADKQF